jgi:hypothetical protein
MDVTKQLSTGLVSAIAVVAHAANRAWCIYNDDNSQLPWTDAPEWQKASMIAAVEFHEANPDAPASASHEAWMAYKLADGWVYGPVKDEAAKTHPCLVPFDQLPKEQQFKDTLIGTVIDAALSVSDAFGGVDQETYDQVVGERDQLAAALNDAVGHIKLIQGDAPGKLRKVGTFKDQQPADDLGVILQSSEVELVFSDGKKEIAGLDPIKVSGATAWQRRMDKWMLTQRIVLSGPAGRDQPFNLVGIALLVDGKQIAWGPLPDPILISAGMQAELRDTVLV